jgi:hypothetical protein
MIKWRWPSRGSCRRCWVVTVLLVPVVLQVGYLLLQLEQLLPPRPTTWYLLLSFLPLLLLRLRGGGSKRHPQLEPIGNSNSNIHSDGNTTNNKSSKHSKDNGNNKTIL